MRVEYETESGFESLAPRRHVDKSSFWTTCRQGRVALADVVLHARSTSVRMLGRRVSGAPGVRVRTPDGPAGSPTGIREVSPPGVRVPDTPGPAPPPSHRRRAPAPPMSRGRSTTASSVALR